MVAPTYTMQRTPGFYFVVLAFLPPVTTVGFWDGGKFHCPQTSDTFEEEETHWISEEIKVKDYMPKDVHDQYVGNKKPSNEHCNTAEPIFRRA
jgi:hypothetical protein